MSKQTHAPRASALVALCGGMLLPLIGHGAEGSAPVQAAWKTQEVRYTYSGFTTAYTCDGAESRIKEILRALGAHEQTRVTAQGCDFNRPSRNFFVTITTAVPVPANDLPAPTETKSDTPTSREQLLKRLGVTEQKLDETFPAEWKTVELSRDRKLRLEPGDCELLEGLRDHVLPKLSMKVTSDNVTCIPRQPSLITPQLTVSALMPLPKVDTTRQKS